MKQCLRPGNKVCSMKTSSNLRPLINGKLFFIICTLTLFIFTLWTFFQWNPDCNCDPDSDVVIIDSVTWTKGSNNDSNKNENTDPNITTKIITLPHSAKGESSTYSFTFDNNFSFKDDFYHKENLSLKEQYPKEIFGVFVEKRRWNIKATLNGHLIGIADDKSFFNPNWLTPAYFSFPAGLLKAQNNQLNIEVYGQTGNTHLGATYIGPHSELQNRYNWRYFKKVTLQHLVSTLIWLFCLSSLFLWLNQRKQGFFLWFTITTFFWALHNSVKPVPIPFYIDHLTWRIILNGSLLWFVFSGYIFLLEVTDTVNRKIWSRVIAFAATILVFLGYLYTTALAQDLYALFIRAIFMPFVFIMGVLCGYQAIKNYLNAKRFALLTIATVTISLVGTHDISIVMGFIKGDYLLQYSAPVLLAIFMFELVSRFVHTVREQETIYKTLGGFETSDIQTSDIGTGKFIDWQNIIESDRAGTISKEKQAFRRELHDGISGPLISVITAIQNKHTEPEKLLVPLKQCMLELRNLIDADENGTINLSGLLANFRAYAEPQLELLNVELSWQVMDLEYDIELETSRARHLFRILQELITNTLKHANASKITFYGFSHCSSVGHNSIEIRISDDGQGIENLNQKGHGLKNINDRIAQMDAHISFDSTNGTQVKLMFEVC